MRLLLDDQDIAQHLTADRAIAWTAEALADHADGRLEVLPVAMLRSRTVASC